MNPVREKSFSVFPFRRRFKLFRIVESLYVPYKNFIAKLSSFSNRQFFLDKFLGYNQQVAFIQGMSYFLFRTVDYNESTIKFVLLIS